MRREVGRRKKYKITFPKELGHASLKTNKNRKRRRIKEIKYPLRKSGGAPFRFGFGDFGDGARDESVHELAEDDARLEREVERIDLNL
jgi:hypothetical protein